MEEFLKLSALRKSFGGTSVASLLSWLRQVQQEWRSNPLGPRAWKSLRPWALFLAGIALLMSAFLIHWTYQSTHLVVSTSTGWNPGYRGIVGSIARSDSVEYSNWFLWGIRIVLPLGYIAWLRRRFVFRNPDLAALPGFPGAFLAAVVTAPCLAMILIHGPNLVLSPLLENLQDHKYEAFLFFPPPYASELARDEAVAVIGSLVRAVFSMLLSVMMVAAVTARLWSRRDATLRHPLVFLKQFVPPILWGLAFELGAPFCNTLIEEFRISMVFFPVREFADLAYEIQKYFFPVAAGLVIRLLGLILLAEILIRGVRKTLQSSKPSRTDLAG